MSLRARLLVGMALVAAVLGVAAVLITGATRDHLVDQIDAQLRLASPGRGDGPGGPGGGIAGPRYSSLYVGIVRDGGRLAAIVTPDLTGEEPPLPDISAERALSAAESRAPFTVGSVGADLRYRAVARAEARSGDVVVFALPLGDVDDAVSRLVTVEVTATVAILAVLALVTWWVIRLGVRPIKQMTTTASAIAAGELSHRVPDVTPRTEAGELGRALNQMLGRIEVAFDERTRSEDRLRRFVADASHELRTPVTTIRGYAELYRAGGLAQPAELDEAMRRTEHEAMRMGSLIDDLLHLARLDQGRPLEQEPVRIDQVVRDAVRDARAVDRSRAVTADVPDGPVEVVGDDARLRQVVANLIGNALVHTNPGTPIEVRVVPNGERVVLEVVDRGPGMSDDVAARAFERFYRADPSRSRHRGGTGLGLAIVQATVNAHGGTVTLDSTPDHGTTVRVDLPRVTSGAGGATRGA